MLDSVGSSVQSKEGLGNKLPDLVKLLEIMTHGGPNKWIAKPPTFRIDMDSSVSIPPDQRAALREVFIYYCSWVEKCTFLHMTRAQFLRFARDTLLINMDVPALAMENLFAQVVKAWPEEAPNSNLTMLSWMKALQAIASTTYPQLSLQQAWEQLLGEHVFTYAGSSGMLDEDKLGLVLLHSNVLSHLEAARPKLRALFDYYANEGEFCYMYGVQRKRQCPPVPPAAATLSPANSQQLLSPVPTGAGASRFLSVHPPPSPSGSFNPLSSPHRWQTDVQSASFPGNLDSPGKGGHPTNGSIPGFASCPGNAYHPGQTSYPGDVSLSGWGGGGGSFLALKDPPMAPLRQSVGPAAQPLWRASSPSGARHLTTPTSAHSGSRSNAALSFQQHQQLQQPQQPGFGHSQCRPTSVGHQQVALPANSMRPQAATEHSVINHHLTLSAFMRMLNDLDVLPNMMSKAQAYMCFCTARYGPRQCLAAEGINSGCFSVHFEEFVEAIGRCALTAFNYQELPPPRTLMVFKDAYQAGAKQMWAADAHTQLQELLKQPNQVDLPPAIYEDCIGREDAAHYDEIEGETSQSIVISPREGTPSHSPRTAASVRSKASNIYRTAKPLTQQRSQVLKRNDAGGAQMLTIHAEADVLEDNSRPLHLKKFNVAWIGEPKLPLNELAKARTEFNRSRNSKEVFLPPVFKQQGADMMTARNNHEQAMEGLRLTYVAARRQQQQAALREIAARRKDLQSRSLQPLVTQRVSLGSTLDSTFL